MKRNYCEGCGELVASDGIAAPVMVIVTLGQGYRAELADPEGCPPFAGGHYDLCAPCGAKVFDVFQHAPPLRRVLSLHRPSKPPPRDGPPLPAVR